MEKRPACRGSVARSKATSTKAASAHDLWQVPRLAIPTLLRRRRCHKMIDMTQSRWVGLQNVEESHRADPISFSIPRSDQRTSLQVGHLVKLIFTADPPSARGLTAERMWVAVQEVRDGRFVGALDNQPSFITNLQPGDAVHFGPEHVAALYTSPSGLKVPYRQFALVSRDLFDDGQFPVEAHRVPPATDDSSGWVVLTRPGDRDPSVRILVQELVARFRILDSILDEPVGTRWGWDSDRLEYVARP